MCRTRLLPRFVGSRPVVGFKSQILVLVVLMALSSTLLPAYADTPPEPSVKPPGYAPRGLGTTYLALGDSLVTGTEDAGNNDNLPGYPDTLARYLRTISPDLILKKDLARDGETSTSMITSTSMTVPSQLDQAINFIKSERAAGRRVGLVTLDIGGNDLIAVLFNSFLDPNAVLATYRTNLQIILDRLLEALTINNVRDGDLLLMDYYNPYPGLVVPGRGKLPDEFVPQLNAIIKEEAAARGLPVAEVATAFAGNEASLIYVKPGYGAFNSKDYDYHPRPAGHRAIASSFLGVSGYRVNVYLPTVRKP